MGFSDPPGQSFTVNQAAGTSGSLSLNCNPSSGPTTIGQSYISNCTGAGGVTPYTWSLTGQLPQGIGWSSSGAAARISGAPTAAGPYVYGLKLTDSVGASATQTFTGNISSGNAGGSLTMSCVPTTGPTAVGAAYTATCTASGGTTPYTFRSAPASVACPRVWDSVRQHPRQLSAGRRPEMVRSAIATLFKSLITCPRPQRSLTTEP